MAAAGWKDRLGRLGLDGYMLTLVLTVILGLLLPARGDWAGLLSSVGFWCVALLFFLYGAKLSTEAVVAGLRNWRLQLSCLICTFVVVPVMALLLVGSTGSLLPAAFGIGLLYLACMPSTVQSSIAFTSIAGGNVAGAVCAASVSNLLGVVLSPLLFLWLVSSQSGLVIETSVIWRICQQILLPFVLGQLARPLLAKFLARHKQVTMLADRGVILLIVYTAFSAGTVAGLWQVTPPSQIALILGLCAVIFAAILGVAGLLAKVWQMPRPDQVSLLFVGSTKSLATGLPMAGILFPGSDLAMIILPLMLYHMLQLFICAILSRRMQITAAAA